MDPRISKDFGLKKIMEKRGFTMENLCSFGDADNDYEMTLHAGVGVVMANGSEKTKSVADYVTRSRSTHTQQMLNSTAMINHHCSLSTGVFLRSPTYNLFYNIQ